LRRNVVAKHPRSWAKQQLLTDPRHKDTARQLRWNQQTGRENRQAQARQHADGHPVALRALPDYDALFGVDCTTTTKEAQ